MARSTSGIRVRMVPTNMFKPSSYFLTDLPSRCFFCGSFLVFVSRACLCHIVLSVPCSIVVTCCEMADLLALLCVMFSCLFFLTFPYGALGKVWYLIVLIPDLFLLLCYKSYEDHNLLKSYNGGLRKNIY